MKHQINRQLRVISKKAVLQHLKAEAANKLLKRIRYNKDIMVFFQMNYIKLSTMLI